MSLSRGRLVMQRGRFPGSCPAARLPKARLLSDISLRCTHKAITVAGTAPVFHRIPSLPVSPLMGPGITNCAAKVRRSIQTAKKNQTFCAHPPSFGSAKARLPTPRSTFASAPRHVCRHCRGMFAGTPRHICPHPEARLPMPRGTFADTPGHVCRRPGARSSGGKGIIPRLPTTVLPAPGDRPYCLP